MRGISPIVAVVLLIAIAVVGSTSIYFFIGGLATKEQGTDQATATAMAATVIDSQNGVVMVQNLGTETIPAQLLSVAGSQSSTKGCVLDTAIQPGQQAACHTTGFEGTETIYGPSLGSAVVKAGAGDTNPYFIGFVKPVGGYSDTSYETIDNAIYSWLVNQGYNVTNFTMDDASAGRVDPSDFDVIVAGVEASYCDTCGACFPAGTMVATGTGESIPIEKLKVGQEVLSPDGTIAKVLNIYHIRRDGYYHLEAGPFKVNVTAEHPFLTTNGFKKASELHVGDVMMTMEGSSYHLNTVSYLNSPIVVYNLKVEGGSHQFYANGFAVHNKI